MSLILSSMFSYLIELLCFFYIAQLPWFSVSLLFPSVSNPHLSFPFCFLLCNHCVCRPYLPFLKCGAFHKAFVLYPYVGFLVLINKLPQTWWVRTIKIHSFMVLDHAPSVVSKGESVSCFFQFLPRFGDYFFPCGFVTRTCVYITPVSLPLNHIDFPTSVCLSLSVSYKNTCYCI